VKETVQIITSSLSATIMFGVSASSESALRHFNCNDFQNCSLSEIIFERCDILTNRNVFIVTKDIAWMCA
jgi:hypothetical protein